MPSLPFRILNVFTQNQGALTGNPLCVFENAAGLDGATMQALARQFNLSETTFILPSSRASAHVRIFTPNYEMPFAGHPTLGTAFVCRALQLGGDDLTLEMQAGIIAVQAQGARWTLQANAPTWRPADASPATLAAMLGLRASDIGACPLWVKAGKEQLIIPLRSEDAVRRARPDSAAFAAIRPGRCLPASARPRMAGVSSVPPRRRRSWGPSITGIQGSSGRIHSRAAPLGPPILWPLKTAASQVDRSTGTLPQAWAQSRTRTAP